MKPFKKNICFYEYTPIGELILRSGDVYMTKDIRYTPKCLTSDGVLRECSRTPGEVYNNTIWLENSDQSPDDNLAISIFIKNEIKEIKVLENARHGYQQLINDAQLFDPYTISDICLVMKCYDAMRSLDGRIQKRHITIENLAKNRD